MFVLYGIEVSDNTTFTATYSTVSATCNVYLCEFVDYGVTGNTNSNWVKVSGTDNKTVTSTGTTLANTTSTRYDIFANLGSTSSVYDFTSPFTIEFDIVEFIGDSARLQVYDATNNQTYNGAGGTGHWKIIVDGTTVKPYKNGVEQTNFTRNIQTARIGFYIITNCAITYKNFVIY